MLDADALVPVQTGPNPWNRTYVPNYVEVERTTLSTTPHGNVAAYMGWDDRQSYQISDYAEILLPNEQGQLVWMTLDRSAYYFDY